MSAVEGNLLGATEAVRGFAGDPGQAIGLLRQQVTSIVAVQFSPLMQIEIPSSVRPPSYEAFQAYSSGLQAWVDGDYAESLRHLERAAALDTTYVVRRDKRVGATPTGLYLGQPTRRPGRRIPSDTSCGGNGARRHNPLGRDWCCRQGEPPTRGT